MTDAEELKRLKRNEARRKRKAAKTAKVKPTKTTALTTPAGAGREVPKTMAAARDGLMQAFNDLGGVDGLVDFGVRHPKEFYALWGRMIPKAEAATASSGGLEALLAKLDQGATLPSDAELLGDAALHSIALSNVVPIHKT